MAPLLMAKPRPSQAQALLKTCRHSSHDQAKPSQAQALIRACSACVILVALPRPVQEPASHFILRVQGQ
eukprot:7880132-Lingulodinium_polyedra.AAC.1